MAERPFTYCPYDKEALAPIPGEPTNARTCPRCGNSFFFNPKPCVAVLILRDGEVLLARRGIEPRKGFWDIPGGFVDASESAEEAAVREAREELRVRTRVTRYLGSIPDVYGPDGVPTLNFCFVSEIEHGEPIPSSDVAELRWFPIASPPEDLAFAHQAQALEWCQEQI